MKRGLFGLIALVLLLSTPSVFAAETFLDLLFGTSDESLLFLKLAYAMLVFIIFVKVTKESVFTKEQTKLANMFSLLLAFFTLRFTPDAWVENFGWVIMAVAPFIIFYKLSAVFVKTEENKFSWIRFFLALIATLFLLFALGSTDAFGISIGSTPYVGGFFDEFFSDANYYLFSSMSPLWSMFLVGLLIGGLFLLFSKMRGGTGTGGGAGGSFLTGLLAVLGIAAILGLLGALLGGGLGGLLSIPGGLLGTILTGLGWLALLALGVGLLYLFFRFRGWRMFSWMWARVTNNWSWLRWVLLILAGIAAVVLLLLYFPWLLYVLIPLALLIGLYLLFRNRTPGAATNGDLVLILQAGAQNVGNIAVVGAPIVVAPGSVTPFVLTAYRRRRLLRNVPLAGANFTVIRVNNGTIAPVTGTSDAQGVLRPVPNYTAANIAGNAQLHIELTHPEINPATVIPDRVINIGAVRALTVRNPAPAPGAAIDVGNFVDIVVEVDDTVSGVNGAQVEIIFPRTPGMTALRGTTTGGSAGTAVVPASPARRNWYGRRTPATPGTAAVLGAPAVVTIRTPAFTAAGTYDFQILVTAAGFANPAPLPGAITVNNPRRENLEIFNQRALVGGRVVSVPTLAAPLPVRVGQTVIIELSVRVPAAGATPARMIGTATIAILPPTNISTVIQAGAGRYTATFRPTAAEIGPQRLVLEATLAGYNNAPPQYLDLEVEDLPTLNVAVELPIPPLRVGMTGVTQILVTDAAGAVVITRVEIFQGTTVRPSAVNGGNTRAGRSRSGLAAGIFEFSFRATTPGSFSFIARVQDARYQGPVDIPFTLIVEALLALRTNSFILDAAGNTLTTTTTLRAGETATLHLHVEDSTGTALAGPIVSCTPPGNIAPRTAPLDAAGNFQTTFTAPVVTRATPFRYSLSFPVPAGYTPPTAIAPLTIIVEAPQMDVQVNVSVPTIPMGSSTAVNVQVTDRRTTNPVPGVTFSLVRVEQGTNRMISLPRTILRLPVWSSTRSSYDPGQVIAGAPLNQGTWKFHLLARAPAASGYIDVTKDFDVVISAAPQMFAVVNWGPDPARSQARLTLTVIDTLTRARIPNVPVIFRPQRGLNATLAAGGAIPVPFTTNAAGKLPQEIVLQAATTPTAPVSFTLTIELQAPPGGTTYTTRRNTFTIRFDPGSRIRTGTRGTIP